MPEYPPTTNGREIGYGCGNYAVKYVSGLAIIKLSNFVLYLSLAESFYFYNTIASCDISAQFI